VPVPAYFGGPAGFPRRDPFALARVGPAPEQPPQFWIDIGEADRWRRDAEAVHRALVERGWAHEWRLFPGSHDGSYWGDHLWEYLPFYAQAFARNGVSAAG
jgi:S-formylglutathione hydrolase FrmB